MVNFLTKLKEDKRTRRIFISYIGAAIAVVLVISGAAIYGLSTEYFCQSCHEMRPYIEAWKKSSHAKVTCYGCHGHPGLINWLLGKAKNLKEPYLHITNKFEKPINAKSHYSLEMENEVCEYCHSMEKRKVTPSRGIKIDHEKHMEKEIKCTRCHNRVAHRLVKHYKGEEEAKAAQIVAAGTVIKAGAYPDRLKMRYCMECHTGGKGGRKGPRKCSACHTKDFDLKPKTHKVKGFVWPIVADKRALHPQIFKKDSKYCWSCHKKDFCIGCHKIEIPHPKKNWVKGKNEHSLIGRSKPQVCLNCHRQPNFCASCHHKWFEPAKGPWIKQHFTTVRRTGAFTCFDCHGPTYCAHCHTRGKKPASIKGP
jgi:nitrate/TMAO reductase-like tetraheme cytochrome c subunit